MEFIGLVFFFCDVPVEGVCGISNTPRGVLLRRHFKYAVVIGHPISFLRRLPIGCKIYMPTIVVRDGARVSRLQNDISCGTISELISKEGGAGSRRLPLTVLLPGSELEYV